MSQTSKESGAARSSRDAAEDAAPMGRTPLESELVGALREIAMFFALPGESDLERFERVAEEFRRETGILAPGKDAGAASSQPESDERRALIVAWVDARVAKARAAIAKAEGAS